ncbi:MAG: arginase family protein, partial [Paracoccaceae bacterium]
MTKRRTNQPLGGNEMPRFAGPNTFMRLPDAISAAGLDVAFVGVPMDIGTSWRPGTRFGPKAIRAESAMLRPCNMATGAAPFDALNCADTGDVAINAFDLGDSVRRITGHYNELLLHDITPMTMGGDHTLSLPVLRAVALKHGPVGLVHIDA